MLSLLAETMKTHPTTYGSTDDIMHSLLPCRSDSHPATGPPTNAPINVNSELCEEYTLLTLNKKS